MAWVGLAAAAIAIGALVAGIVTLSQRRQAFVSAVTHELRTPLTTFRMYAEMLDENMVTTEHQRRDYLHTLRVEADRLWHLVENVLSYARLERSRRTGARERITVDALWSRVEPRLRQRAEHAGMELAVERCDDGNAICVHTDPAAVEQILFNLVDNAGKYAGRASDRTICVRLSVDGRNVQIRVRDHGPGVAPDAARRLFRPFAKSAHEAAHSAPGVGLGLALCRRLARQLGGDLRYEPPDGPGAAFVVTLPGA
jgi:signal transduction histidine kinase